MNVLSVTGRPEKRQETNPFPDKMPQIYFFNLLMEALLWKLYIKRCLTSNSILHGIFCSYSVFSIL